jgi:3-isopropylmalate dehydratase small subunit
VQNIDTDQIIPAEYLTLVPSKVIPQIVAADENCCQATLLADCLHVTMKTVLLVLCLTIAVLYVVAH